MTADRVDRRSLLVTALRSEFVALGGAVPPSLAVERCGMGEDSVGKWFARSAARSPSAVVVAGVGGGLDPSLRPGDVVVATEVRDLAGTVPLRGGAPLVAALREAGLSVQAGPIVTCPEITDGEHRRRLAATGAVAVDMESAAIARRFRAVPAPPPVAVVRVIVDPMNSGVVRPATIVNGVRALLTLRAISRVLPAWTALPGPRKVLLAGPRSFCAGVERAIDVVEHALRRYPHPVYVRREIVHNAHVVSDLRRRGAVFVDELDQIPDGAVVVFSAHGVARAVREEAARRALTVIDATCPLVTKVHQEAERFAAEGCSVLLIGHAGHDESEGTLGRVPGHIQLVESAAQAEHVTVPDPSRVALVTQTTLTAEDAGAVAEVLRRRFPEVREPGSDDICYATTNRQRAVRAVAEESDVVLVLGSRNSSNSLRLVETAQRCGTPAYLIDDATAIRPSWLAHAGTVGITAGASAPPYLVDEVIGTLRDLGPVDVEERTVARETLTFSLPRGVVH